MTAVKTFFVLVLVTMLVVTIRASFDRSVMDAFVELLRDAWGLATLADAYFGFLTFYVWVFYRERGLAARVIWLVLILAFGNIAMSVYALIQLARLPEGATVETFLLRRPA